MRRAQAALFDGILFLLMATASCALIFSYISTYGVQEEAVMRSAYMLNYMQSVMKTMYYLDASTLQKVGPEGVDAYKYMDCKGLGEYKGSIGVADLLKKDIDEGNEKLDDKFGGDAEALGRTAMRCAMKELMKPLAYSGYYYFMELTKPGASTPDTTAVVPLDDAAKAISNNPGVIKGNADASGCDAVKAKEYQTMVVAAPFAVIYTPFDPNTGEPGTQETRRYSLRVCIWKS